MTRIQPHFQLPQPSGLDATHSNPAPLAEQSEHFGSELQSAIDNVKKTFVDADKTAAKGLIGDAQPHQVMLALTKADLALRFVTQVRNNATDAYNEIMRMQL